MSLNFNVLSEKELGVCLLPSDYRVQMITNYFEGISEMEINIGFGFFFLN